MKKLVCLLLCLMLLVPALAVAESFSATEAGFGGDVTVTLTIEGDKLTDVAITGENETETVGGAAIPLLAEAMLAANSVEVDGIAGATFTSNAVLAAAKSALDAAGITLVASVTAQESATVEDETTDVLVIGAGGGGLSAAISATEAGASVILVEKLALVGGCSAMSGGVFTRAAVETDSDPAMSGEELYEFLMSESEDRADSDLVHLYVDNSIDTFNWVYDNMVAHPENQSRYAMIPESIVSPWLPGSGGELVHDIQAYAEGLGIDIRTETPATALITDDTGRVIGATVTTPSGATQNIYANGGVILATGGFASSPEMLAKYSTPGAETIASYASAGVVGDGLVMAEVVGAKVHFTDDWDTCGSFTLAFTGYATAQMHYPMLLNSNGERFVNEASIQPTVYTEMRHQIANGCENAFWFITDDNIEPDTQWLVDNAGGVKVDTVEEIAEIIGAPVETVQASIDAYNANAGTDNDPFGKPATYEVGVQAPYTVIFSQPMRTTTIGGLSITTSCEVMAADDGVVPGLYACGEVANSNFYGTVYTCGTALGSAIIFGRIAGANAAAAAK